MIDFFINKKTLNKFIYLFVISAFYYLISLYFTLNKGFLNFEEFLNLNYFFHIEIYKVNFIYILNILIFLWVLSLAADPKNLKEKIIYSIIILNPFIILITNYFLFDLFVFYLIFFITQNSSVSITDDRSKVTQSSNKIYLVNWILIAYCIIQNFIYISLVVSTFIENNKRFLYQNVFLIFLFFTISLIIVVSNFDQILKFNYLQYIDIIETKNLIYSFSFINFLNLLNQYINLNYYLLILILVPIIFVACYLIKRNFIKQKLYKNVIGIFHFKERLFLLAGNLLILKYFFSFHCDFNDIYLILLFPLIYKFYDKFKVKLLFYLILSLVTKIFASYIYIFSQNSLITMQFKNLIIFLDLINIIFVITIVFSLNSIIFQNLEIKRKRFFKHQKKLQL